MNKNKIIEHFGAVFFEKVLSVIDKYTTLWELSDLRQIDYFSVNCLFTCVSTTYGHCILKISPHLNETRTEYSMLKEFDSMGLCRVYKADIDNGVLLIERITPGTQLRDEPDLDTRLNVFCELFQGLHKPPANKTAYPTYLDWVVRIAAYMRTRTDFKELSDKMTKAEEVCRYLWGKYNSEMLLHGDFHHDNILMSNNGYRIIDPKGVIGDRVFDIPRFMLNEDDMEKDNKFNYVVGNFAKILEVPEKDIVLLYFVEMCLGNSWCVESNDEVSWKDVLFAEKMMNEATI